MRAGHLDQRVTVERLSGGVDELGQPLPDTWVPLFTRWASVEPLQGREFIAAQAALSEVTGKIKMRYRPGVTAADRIVHNTTVYGIQAVIDVRSEHRELVLMVRAIG